MKRTTLQHALLGSANERVVRLAPCPVPVVRQRKSSHSVGQKNPTNFVKRGIRILLADDRALVRSGIRALLEKSPSLKVVAEATNGHQMLQLARKCKPSVDLFVTKVPPAAKDAHFPGMF